MEYAKGDRVRVAQNDDVCTIKRILALTNQAEVQWPNGNVTVVGLERLIPVVKS